MRYRYGVLLRAEDRTGDAIEQFIGNQRPGAHDAGTPCVVLGKAGLSLQQGGLATFFELIDLVIKYTVALQIIYPW